MEDMREPYEHYYDNYEDSEINYDDYYEYLAERDDMNYDDNYDE